MLIAAILTGLRQKPGRTMFQANTIMDTTTPLGDITLIQRRGCFDSILKAGS